MASNERPELVDLAAKVADGAQVDWRRASEGPFDDRDLLEGLRLLERIAEVHGSLTASSQNSTSSDKAESHRSDSADGADPRQWGQLLIGDRLGHGSFGTVYRAWDSRLDRRVALKLLADRKELAATTETLPDSAIVEEGRLLAPCASSNVITVYGARSP